MTLAAVQHVSRSSGSIRLLTAVALGTLLLVSAGCPGSHEESPRTATVEKTGESEEHDHSHDGHAHEPEGEPKTYAEAIQQLQTLVEQVRTAFADKDLSKADGPVHAIGHLLEHIKELPVQSEADAASEKAVADAVTSLLDLFGQLDTTIHSGSGKSFTDLESEIMASVNVLKDVSSSSDQKK